MPRYQLNAPPGHILEIGDRRILGGMEFVAEESEVASLPEGLVSEAGDQSEVYTETYDPDELESAEADPTVASGASKPDDATKPASDSWS